MIKPLRRLQECPMSSNAFIYGGYAVAATLAVQTLEQWYDQPMNARKRGGGNGDISMETGRWTWTWEFRIGDDPDLKPVKDLSEPYYNLAISAYRESPPEEPLRKKS